ncbi:MULTISPECIES: hypothetical protein [Acinetobacter]|uniref:hypothetical protein n=1 Tax=Acinetobacter sp. WC-141 TaxID=903915 RepID=UPI0002EF1340|nr:MULTISPECIES: hypothetical protein [Acinetobacter]
MLFFFNWINVVFHNIVFYEYIFKLNKHFSPHKNILISKLMKCSDKKDVLGTAIAKA